MYEYDWWKMYKTDNSVKHHLREGFPDRMPVSKDRLLEIIKAGSPFGYVQCDFEVPENLRQKFLRTFHPTSKTLMLVVMTLVRL